MFSWIKNFFVDIGDIYFEIVHGTCANCIHSGKCHHQVVGDGHCWERGYGIHYERDKSVDWE